MFTLADDFGRYEANRTLLASECFPFGEPDTGAPIGPAAIDSGLRALAGKDLLYVYAKDGKEFVQFTRWKERIRQHVSKFPDPQGCALVYGQAKAEQPNPPTFDSKCPQMIAYSPSPSPSPAPTPSPVASTCPQAGPFETIKAELFRLYNRQNGRLTFLEESVLAEICRSEHALAELAELRAYRDSLPANERHWFPNAMEALLTKWQPTLDRARQARNAKPARSGPSLKDVADLCREKWPDDGNSGRWAASFHGYWSDPKRRWLKNGRLIDWPVELSAQVSRWRTTASV